ncbi:MAG: pyridoxine 5'-phosphate synthase [Candidatus Edwardsbacteria bacterium]|jgi:pyridoxine 5-phosphate synthase|nr:pyridoxine 5'-phosphate synthase [Candidatus Edwardsbacteria bacterium]
MEQLRLGINIDHIATLRQARRASQPDPVAAAAIATLAGADGITIHLRGDRRHIQPRDAELLRRTVDTHLNIEVAVSGPALAAVRRLKPDAACLVPERPGEVSTEGGLDLAGVRAEAGRAIRLLRAAGIATTCFIEPEERQIRLAAALGADNVELNTKAYAESRGRRRAAQAARVAAAARLARQLGLGVHAGHGLDYHNVGPIAAIGEVSELNIGHAIVARAALVGLDRAVRDMRSLLRR